MADERKARGCRKGRPVALIKCLPAPRPPSRLYNLRSLEYRSTDALAPLANPHLRQDALKPRSKPGRDGVGADRRVSCLPAGAGGGARVFRRRKLFDRQCARPGSFLFRSPAAALLDRTRVHAASRRGSRTAVADYRLVRRLDLAPLPAHAAPVWRLGRRVGGTGVQPFGVLHRLRRRLDRSGRPAHILPSRRRADARERVLCRHRIAFAVANLDPCRNMAGARRSRQISRGVVRVQFAALSRQPAAAPSPDWR